MTLLSGLLLLSALSAPATEAGGEIDAVGLLAETRARLERGSLAGGRTAEGRLDLARQLLDAGLYDRAERLLDDQTDRVTGDVDGQALRARLHLARSEFVEAQAMRDLLADRAERSPDAALAYLDLLFLQADLPSVDAWARARPEEDALRLLAEARLAYRLNRLHEAESLYRKAEESGAPSREVLLGVSRCAQRLKRVDEARDLAAESLREHGPDPDLLHHWGSLLVRSGRAAEAVGVFEAVAKAYPWHERTHYSLGNGYARRNYTELEAASPAAFPRDEGFVEQQEAARSALAGGKIQEARRILDVLNRSYPTACEPPAAKASLFWNEGDWRKAERWCRESLRREPFYGRAHAILAKTLEAKRMALEIHRYRDNRDFEKQAMPEVPAIETFVLNWSSLTDRHQKRIALSLEPFAPFIPVLVDGGQTFYVKLLHERLSETPKHESLRDERISYDSRLWDDVRGCGGNDTVIGIEDVERSIFGRDDTALHELAHQVHHILLEEDKSRIERAFTAALQRDAEGEDVFVNRYSASSVWEYFAEGVHSWETLARDDWDTRHALRRRLLERDEELARISKHYTSLEEVSPYRAPALAARADNEMDYNRLAEARTFLDRARKIDADEETVLAAGIRWHLYSGKAAEAAELAAGGREIHPRSLSLALASSTALLHASGERAEALALLAEARGKVDEARRHEIDQARGWLLLEDGRLAEAAALFRTILREREDEPGALQGLLNALALAEDTKGEEFEDILVRLVRKRSGLRTVRADAARALARRGEFDRAREQVREGLLNAPDSDQVLAAAAWVEWRAGKLREAAGYAQRAIEAAGGAKGCWNDLAVLVRARIDLAGGGKEKARAAVEALRERAKSPPEFLYVKREHDWRSVHRFGPWEREILEGLEAALETSATP